MTTVQCAPTGNRQRPGKCSPSGLPAFGLVTKELSGKRPHPYLEKQGKILF